MVYALVDCNNFFVSCERVFRPDWENKPVVVLSNNDGCVISRSNEVKALGVPMGAPYFQYKQLFIKEKVVIRSTNFQLYTNLSQRVASILSEFTEDQYIYSVDESFLSFPDNFTNDWVKLGQDIADKVKKCVGIPVSVGFANTKTLSKLAAEVVKKKLVNSSACSFVSPSTNFQNYGQNFEVGKIWGIGRQYSKKLKAMNVLTIKDFIGLPPITIKNEFSILGLKTWNELQGIDCISLKDVNEGKKGILSSRSFGKLAKTKEELALALSGHIETVARKLRLQNSKTAYLSIYLTVGNFGFKQKFYLSKAMVINPTNYTPELFSFASLLLDQIYNPSFSYRKLGISVGEIQDIKPEQDNLFISPEDLDKKKRAMESLDNLQTRFGSLALRPASSVGLNKTVGKSEYSSPNYTTKWSDLASAK